MTVLMLVKLAVNTRIVRPNLEREPIRGPVPGIAR